MSHQSDSDAINIDDWSGVVSQRTDNFNGLSVVAPVASARNSWSGPFRVIASDENDYFVKSLDVCPPGHAASLAIERIVADVGELIGAPTCETSLIRIPEEIAGWEPRPGVHLTAGIAHASKALERADEDGRPRLIARQQDDNQRRHVGAYALYDWCFGFDAQWLYDLDDDRRLYSHDHGLYFPPIGQGLWTRNDLIAMADQVNELPDPRDGLSMEAVTEIAAALDKIDQTSLAAILNSVPACWPVTDQDLDALGWFLQHRAPAVAQRVRALI